MRRGVLAHPLRSVRVRITLAAVAVTAVAVGTAGALLVRTVEDRETGRVRADIDADLEQVAAQLEDGMSPCEVMGSMDSRSSSGFLQISDPGGRVFTFATGPEGTLYSAQVHGGGGGFTAGDDAALPPTGDVTGDPVLPCGGHPPGSGSATPSELILGEDVRTDGADRGGADRDDSDRGGGTAPPGSQGAPPPPAGEQMQSVLLGRGGAVPGTIETVARSVDTPEGPMTVVAAVPIDQLAGTVDTLRRGLSFGLPALIAVVAALAWVLVGRALRPVEAIRAEVDAITGSTMHRRVPVPSTGDEIGRLAHTMNAMLGRLDAAATRQRQFVSDASHELRSPVAALRTCLEVAGRRPDRADWPAVVDTALAEESRLEGLLDDLLLLAAHDEGAGVPPPADPVDLAALAAAEAGRPRRMPVEVVLPAGDAAADEAAAGAAVVRGDADRLARALANLVDNAVRYATDAVQVAVAQHDGVVRVTVDDDGPGIRADDRERVFERFTRLDDGRARPQGGTGLGLAVVRSIVAQHHGRVWAEDGALGGARLTVEVPAAPAPP